MEIPKLDIHYPETVLKAISSLDEMYLDEEGRHVIFRTINGNVVPIRTTAEDYVSWLETQGVVVPDDQQAFLRSVDDELYRIATMGQDNPALAQQMEKEFSNRLKQMTQYNQAYYNQVMELQAQAAGIEAQQYQQQRQAKLQENLAKQAQQPAPTDAAGRMKDYLRYERRDKLENKGWDSHITGITNRLIEDYGAKENTPLWYTLQAFDLALRMAVDKIGDGARRYEVDLLEVLKEEVTNYQGFSRHFDHYVNVSGGDDKINYNLPMGIDNLLKNLKSGNEGAKYLSDIFDEAYDMMVDDLVEDLSSVDTSLPTPTDKSLLREVPDELPPTFSKLEGSRVMDWYQQRTKGEPSRVFPSAKAAAKHSLIRTFNSLSEDAQTMLLQHGQGSLGARHEHGAKVGFNEAVEGLAESPEEILESAVRSAQRASDPRITSEEKVKQIGRMAHLLGKLEGASIYAQREMTLPGKQKPSFERLYQNGYNAESLVAELSDPEKRGRALLDNKKHLRLGKAPTTQTPLDNLPKVEERPKETKVDTPKEFTRDLDSGAFVHTESGLHVKPTGNGNLWGIYTPEGERLDLFTPTNAKNQTDLLTEASAAIGSLSEGNKPDETESIETPVAEEPVVEEPAPEVEEPAAEVDPTPEVAPVETPTVEAKPTPTKRDAPKTKPEAKKPEVQRTITNTEVEYGKNVSFSNKLNARDRDIVDPIVEAANNNGLEMSEVVPGRSDKINLPDGTEIYINLNQANNAVFAIKEPGSKIKVIPQEDALSAVSSAASVVTAEVDTTTQPEPVETPSVPEPVEEVVPEVETAPETIAEEETEAVEEQVPETAEERAPVSNVEPLHPDLKVDHMPAEERAKLDAVTNFVRNNGLEVVEASEGLLSIRPVGTKAKPTVDTVHLEIDKRGELSVIPTNRRRLTEGAPDYTSKNDLSTLFGIDPASAVMEGPTEVVAEQPTEAVEQPVAEQVEAQPVEADVESETLQEVETPTSPKTSSPEWNIARTVTFPKLNSAGKGELDSLRYTLDRYGLNVETKGSGETKQYNVIDRDGNVVLGVTGAHGTLQFYDAEDKPTSNWASVLRDAKDRMGDGDRPMYPIKNIEIPRGNKGAKALSDFIRTNKLGVTTDYNGNYIISDSNGEPKFRFENVFAEDGLKLYDLNPGGEDAGSGEEEIDFFDLEHDEGHLEGRLSGEFYTKRDADYNEKYGKSQTEEPQAEKAPQVEPEDVPEVEPESGVEEPQVEPVEESPQPEQEEAEVAPEEIADEAQPEVEAVEVEEVEAEAVEETSAPVPEGLNTSVLSPENADKFTKINNFISEHGLDAEVTSDFNLRVRHPDDVARESKNKRPNLNKIAVNLTINPRTGELTVIPNIQSRVKKDGTPIDPNNLEDLYRTFGVSPQSVTPKGESPETQESTTIPMEEVTVEEATQVDETPEPEPAAVEVPETQATEDSTVPSGEEESEPAPVDEPTGRDGEGGQSLADIERTSKKGKVKSLVRPKKVSAAGKKSLEHLDRAASGGTSVNIAQDVGGYDYVVGVSGLYNQTAIGLKVDEAGDITYHGLGEQAKDYAEKLKDTKNLDFNRLKEMMRVWKPGESSEESSDRNEVVEDFGEEEPEESIDKKRTERAEIIEESLIDMGEDPGTIPFDKK